MRYLVLSDIHAKAEEDGHPLIALILAVSMAVYLGYSYASGRARLVYNKRIGELERGALAAGWDAINNVLVVKSTTNEDLVRRHQRGVYALARRFTRNHEDADDVAQESFLRAWRGITAYDPSRPFRPWLYRIVVNTALNHLRAIRNRKEDELGESDGLPAPPPLFIGQVNLRLPRRRGNPHRLERLMMEFDGGFRLSVVADSHRVEPPPPFPVGSDADPRAAEPHEERASGIPEQVDCEIESKGGHAPSARGP